MIRLASPAIALGLVAACSSGGTGDSAQPSVSATASPSISEPPSVADPEEARRALAEAVQAMRELEGVHFVVDVGIEGLTGFAIDGTYSPTGGWKATTTLRTSDSDLASKLEKMDVVSKSGSLWMQMHNWPDDAGGCWLKVPKNLYPLKFAAMTPDAPRYISSLTRLKATAFRQPGGTTVLATLPFEHALYLLNGQTILKLKLDKPPASVRVADHRLPVVVELRNGLISSLVMQGEDFVRLARDSGAKLSADLRTVMDQFLVTVTYAESAPVRVEAPDPDVVPDEGKGCRDL